MFKCTVASGAVALVFVLFGGGVARGQTAVCTIQPSGVIADRWSLTGGASGPLGCPTGAADTSPSGGQAMSFQGGQIVTSPALGSQAAVAGYQQGSDLVVDWGDTSPTSYPTFAMQWSVAGGQTQQRTFSNGFGTRGVWFVPQPSAGTYSLTVSGCQANGACTTADPVSVVFSQPTTIVACPGDSFVTGIIRDRWLSLGGGGGPLGCPAGVPTEPFAGANGLLAVFDNGSITTSPDQTSMTLVAYQVPGELSIHMEWGDTTSTFSTYLVRWDENVDANGLNGTNAGQITTTGFAQSGQYDLTVTSYAQYGVTVKGCNPGDFGGSSCDPDWAIEAVVNVQPISHFVNQCIIDAPGLIGVRWRGLQGPDGPLGCPTDAQYNVPGTDAIAQDFEHGQLVNSPDQGPNLVVAFYEEGGQLYTDWSTSFPRSYDLFIVRSVGPGLQLNYGTGPKVDSGRAAVDSLFPQNLPAGTTVALEIEGCNLVDGVAQCDLSWTVPAQFTYGTQNLPPIDVLGVPDFSALTPVRSLGQVDDQMDARAELASQAVACTKVLGSVTNDEQDWMVGAIAKLDRFNHGERQCPYRTTGTATVDYRTEVNESLRQQEIGSDVGTTCPTGGHAEYDVALTGYVRLYYEYASLLDADVRPHILNDLLDEYGPFDPGQTQACGGLSPETENHLNQIESARYLTNQAFYAQNGQPFYDNEANGMNAYWLRRLQGFLQNDFFEYNSKPYQSYTDNALQNLYDFAKDRRVKMAAKLVLDYISAKWSVSSSSLRRDAPYRRRESEYSTGFFDFAKGDYQTGRFAVLAGDFEIFGDPSFNPPWQINSVNGPMVMAGVSTYRVPDPILDLIVNAEQRTFYQRIMHATAETYSSTPDYLITGGGFPTPALKQVAAGDACFGCDDIGVAVPITLMPTDEFINSDDLIRFDGAGLEQGLNTCVGPNFACGIGLQIPTSYQTNGCTKTVDANGGTWTFIDFSDPGCNPRIAGSGQAPHGFYVAAWNGGPTDPNPDPDQPISGYNSYGLFEAHPRDASLSFTQFADAVIENNGSFTFSFPGPNVYRLTSGEVLQFTIPTTPDPTNPAVTTTWPFAAMDQVTLDSLGTDETTWPLASGDVLNSVGRTGLVTFRNPGSGAGVVLDFSDFGEPREQVVPAIVGQSKIVQILSLAVPQDWTVSNGTGTPSPISDGGYGSLSVAGTGWTTITSAPMSAADIRTTASGAIGSVSYELEIPSAPQPNPYWIGATQMYLSAPSAGIYNAYLGQVELTGQPTASFVSETFAIPGYAQPSLAGGASDVTLTIVLNVNAATGPWRLTNVRFGD